MGWDSSGVEVGRGQEWRRVEVKSGGGQKGVSETVVVVVRREWANMWM